MFLVVLAIMVFFGCSENNTTAPEINQNDQVPASLAKPLPNLIGTAYTAFTFTPPTFWNGTIDFGVDGKYGLTFISHEEPRGYSQASPYYEDFYIYEEGTDWTIPENVYLKGWNAGVVTYANKNPDPVKFRANGKIDEAYGPFEEWQGRNVHIRGEVIWNDPDNGLPKAALGTFRIN
jgi:hypothetical protein